MFANTMIVVMIEINNASNHSLLWGHSIEFWDRLGIKALIWGAFIGVAALLLTTASAYILYRVADVAQKDLESESKVSAVQIGELSKQAEQLRKDTADANARAVEAQLALEKFKAPRLIGEEQQKRIDAALKQFAGTLFDIGIGPKGDPEPIYVARAIHAALTSARWSQIPWTGGSETYTEPGMESVGLTSVTNIIVDVHPDWWLKYKEAATALAKALSDNGIDAIVDTQSTSIKSDAIHIRIGRKL